MEQQQFKVSRPLGTKLLASIVSLLFVVIVFLNVYVILILNRDKRDDIFESGSKEAVLAGREVVNTARHAFDTLRLTLASIDPLKPMTPLQTAAVKSVIDNQSDIFRVSIKLVDAKTGQAKPFTDVSKDKEMADLKLTAQDIDVSDTLPRNILDELLRNSFALVNATKLGGAPVLAVLVADTKFKDVAGGMPVALGAVSLLDFARELAGLHLTVATKSGRVLYDTDPTILSPKDMEQDPLFSVASHAQVSNGALEYEVGGVRYLGSFVQPGVDLVVLNRTDWKQAAKATYALTERFIVAGGMAVGLAVLFALFFSKTLTRPINRLVEATREVMQGKFDLDLSIGSKDEIGALTGSFNAMSRKISELIAESMKKVQLENELAIASTVQQTLIPPPVFKDDRIQIHSHYQSASQCGGDWWGFFKHENKMCVMIADATGHGFPSALITAAARSCFSVVEKLAQEDPHFDLSPGHMLRFANRSIYEAGMQKIMMTFFIGVIDFDKKTLTYASAAHNPPWIFRPQEGGFALSSMTVSGMRLGESLDPPPFEEKSAPFAPGDILFLYTDGLMEGRNPEGEMYGKKRVRKTIEASLSNGIESTVQVLMSDFLAYNGGKELDDDVTIAFAAPLG